MKQTLRFQSEQEFQSFFAQLSSAEMPYFQAVEGSGGDKGFDGLSDTTAYQAYYAEEKNRTNANFISKINRDIEKILQAKKELGLEITEWVFVVPEDLRISVVAHLAKKSKETGLRCIYWGATKLTELTSKHPQIIESFPLIFMPSVKHDLKEVKGLISQKKINVSLENIEILGDQDFERKYENIEREYSPKIDGFPRRPDGSLYHPLRADLDYIDEMQRKIDELRVKKEKSDLAYELEREDIIQHYNKEIEHADEDFSQRGMSHSDLKIRTIKEIDTQKNRDIERLQLKYGITRGYYLFRRKIAK